MQAYEKIRQWVDHLSVKKKLIFYGYVITLAEKESELAALQAQINPHFLYNTLDSLYWQAMNADNEEIAESILALSQLFRLVLSQGKREVTVGQETELFSRYLQIQKMRFSKRKDEKYFSKVFKKIKGVSPKEYRMKGETSI